ncbi:hypothetical protein FOZ60_011591 [Perkinsus olseni]|uniref:Uncharacterized protein n=1 Tax=Perkinsus olseni TaxID=32597 RepID=A0A7J6NE36_PEROL|nr:hypothetical protein FOZ60_011591 [Perkinsus olseni]
MLFEGFSNDLAEVCFGQIQFWPQRTAAAAAASSDSLPSHGSGQAVVVVATTGDVVEEIVARAFVRWILRALDVVVAERSVIKEMMYHGQEEADARATMVDAEELESVDVQDLLGFGQHALAGVDADVDREVEFSRMICGRSIAPAMLETAMSHVSALLPEPLPATRPIEPRIDTAKEPHVPRSWSYMDGILSSYSSDTTELADQGIIFELGIEFCDQGTRIWYPAKGTQAATD